VTTQPTKNSATGSKLWRKPRRWWLLGIPVGGFVMFFIGIIF
jgi:membrane-associated protease RseP (regulator of RpoE activity)